MQYDVFSLEGMSLEELKNVANSLGIVCDDEMKADDIIYRIIESQTPTKKNPHRVSADKPQEDAPVRRRTRISAANRKIKPIEMELPSELVPTEVAVPAPEKKERKRTTTKAKKEPEKATEK